MSEIDKDEIVRLTEEYGGQWGINHTRRLLELISVIGKDRQYNAEVIWVAAHLHDWGGYPKWMQAGVDHALRSRQVAEGFLVERSFAPELLTPTLECIEYHHGSDPTRRIETILLSDADALDFLGVVGVLRDFSKKPSDLRKAYEVVQNRKEKLRQSICLETSKTIAVQRLEKMERLLEAFEEETFGYF
ncbi:MAG: HD domain-containing protein [Deltaproteobacteria bacterium]|nr:HD domain-containing protein [Deltaproteobacteria bacterium]